jgi:hypothetical protein
MCDGEAHYIHMSFSGWDHHQTRKSCDLVLRANAYFLLQALAYSASRTGKNVEHLHSIFVSTYAVLFLGTPHNGSSKAKLAGMGRRMLDALAPSKLCDTDGQLLDALQEGSETLQNITDQFAPLMKKFHIYFFWEQEKTDLKSTRDYVSLQTSTTDNHSTPGKKTLRY